ncbi:MAG: MBL fold metallo-hydrolase [Clostridiaceae bacterium]|jgi:7,8-dihydropterin-6-yl-methyl-4-(beta-D-ribofuranosyl)aminobenzene 5'-phosphate synthase|nr:MBL fold metallo-hydrolase [Clostridiaceae bacterium]
MLKITVLVENSVRRRHLVAEHGLSFWLELDDARILFDAGQSDAYLHNARQLGIDISQADRAVLSHGHYDHGDGFRFFPADQAGWPRFYAHPDAFAERFGHDMRNVDLSWQVSDQAGLDKRLMLNTGTMEIAREVCLVCRLPELAGSAGISPGFLIRKNGVSQPDLFLDEQILVSRQDGGLVVVCGCCHPGLLHALNGVRQLYPREKIQAVLGGFHLSQASDDQLDDLSRALQVFEIDRLIPMHCSGIPAWCRLKAFFGERCLQLQTGDSITF